MVPSKTPAVRKSPRGLGHAGHGVDTLDAATPASRVRHEARRPILSRVTSDVRTFHEEGEREGGKKGVGKRKAGKERGRREEEGEWQVNS